MKINFIVLALMLTCAACSERQSVATEDRSPRDESAAATETPSQIFDLPYLMRDLDNGLRVIVVETEYPDIVDLQVLVQAGVRNEIEKGKTGFAHFFEHMMYRGTDNYSTEEYVDILKNAGAESNAFTRDDYTNYFMTFTRPDLEKMIEIEADRFQNLNYSEAGFRTEALSIKGEYLKNYSDPLLAAFERARSLAFSLHPYKHTTMGLIEDIEQMPEQMEYSKTFFERWYRPGKTAIIIVGDVDAEATFELVKKYWDSWESADVNAEIPVEPAPSGPVYEHIQWTSETQPWLLIGFRSPAFVAGEKDVPAMNLLSSVYFSSSSELYQNLVIDEQWVDELATDFPLNRDPNLNLIYTRLTDAAHAANVEAAILRTLASARMRQIEDQVFEDTKSHLRYSFVSQLDNSADIGAMLAEYVQYDRTPETVNEMYAAYDELTPEDIRQFANVYFTDESRVTVSLSGAPEIPGIGVQLALNELIKSDLTGDETRPETRVRAEVVADRSPVNGRRMANNDDSPVEFVTKPLSTSPLVDVSILVHTGSAMDPEGKKGLAALTAAMLTGGSSTVFPIQEINQAMYPIASSFEVSVDKEMTRLSGQVHRDNLDIWYRYVRSQLLDPGWNDQDIERLKQQQKNAIATELITNNDEELAKEVLYASIYGVAHPYGSLNLGSRNDIDSISIDDVKGFYRNYFTAGNMTVGLSGSYPESFVARLESDLQRLSSSGPMARSVLPPTRLQASKVTIVEKETPAVAVSLGFPIELKRGDKDWVALWLARSYLGEHRSDNGRLYQRIREIRGMNYGNYAYVEYFPQGMYQMRPDTNVGRQQQIFQIWIRPLPGNNEAHFATRAAVFELDKLVREGISESDFEKTRAYLSRFASLMTDGQSRQLGYALDSKYYGTAEFAEYVKAGLQDLTAEDVNRVIREQLQTEQIQYVFVTRDADDLRQRIAEERLSPVRYDAEKPAEILTEDATIEALVLGVDEARIDIVAAENLFR